MASIKLILILLASTAHLIFGNINFSARSIILEFPSTIVASGNAIFSGKKINISANRFTYNSETLMGTFQGRVIIKFPNSTLKGDSFSLKMGNQSILGHGNISFSSTEIMGYSDDLIVENFEILTLKNNVFIEQQGRKIKSNELMYNVKTDTILSNKRVKLIIED